MTSIDGSRAGLPRTHVPVLCMIDLAAFFGKSREQACLTVRIQYAAVTSAALNLPLTIQICSSDLHGDKRAKR